MSDIKYITITTRKVVKLAIRVLNYHVKKWSIELHNLSDDNNFINTPYGVRLSKQIAFTNKVIDDLGYIWTELPNDCNYNISDCPEVKYERKY